MGFYLLLSFYEVFFFGNFIFQFLLLFVFTILFLHTHNYWRASEASETLSGLFNRESQIYILLLCIYYILYVRAFPNALLSGAAPRNSNYTKNIFFNKKFLITSD